MFFSHTELSANLYIISKNASVKDLQYSNRLLRSFAVSFGRYSDKAFEELSKERDIREIQYLGDLLDVTGGRT